MTVKIRARERGPLVVEGEIELLDARGAPIDVAGRRQVLLCRCGASKTAPLCDGTHNRIRFETDDGSPPTDPS